MTSECCWISQSTIPALAFHPDGRHAYACNEMKSTVSALAYDPKLVFATWDWGNGDWETALGGASHTAHAEVARYLLSQGARIDAFCAAMLGEREAVGALLKADPATATTKGPHGFTLLYHAAASGDLAIAEMIKPLLPAGAKDYDQALGAAKRGNHAEMTQWLLANGATKPAAP